MMEEQQFDYAGAMARLEEIALKAEDPSTGLDDMDSCIEESSRLIEKCRAYLRGVRQTVENL